MHRTTPARLAQPAPLPRAGFARRHKALAASAAGLLLLSQITACGGGNAEPGGPQAA